MPRIAGVDIPKEKRIEISLTYIYGIGRTLAGRVLKEASVDPSTKAQDLTDGDVSKISSVLQRGYRIEGELQKKLTQKKDELILKVLCADTDKKLLKVIEELKNFKL